MSPSPTLRIDVVSDVVCPWCFVGKRRLDAALAQLAAAGEPVPAVHWHPFELNPDLPRDGIDRRQYLTAKFGGAQRAAAIYERVRAAGATAGIDFAFDRILRQPNTRDAHRLIAWAEGQGADDASHDAAASGVSTLVERVFRAYFCEGRSLVGVAALADLAGEAGYDRDAALAWLESDRGIAEVSDAEQRAHAIGVTGVPFFILAGRVAVSGAQDTEILLRAISQAREYSASA